MQSGVRRIRTIRLTRQVCAESVCYCFDVGAELEGTAEEPLGWGVDPGEWIVGQWGGRLMSTPEAESLHSRWRYCRSTSYSPSGYRDLYRGMLPIYALLTPPVFPAGPDKILAQP
jgi:hypothetical protein